MQLSVEHERWPITGGFTISRGTKSQADVLVVTLSRGSFRGRGECVPYARYGESLESVMTSMTSIGPWLQDQVLSSSLAQIRRRLLRRMEPGAARNAIDCALWDLEAKTTVTPVWKLAGVAQPESVTTAFTISLGTCERMAASVREAGDRPLLKLKLGGPEPVDSADGDLKRLASVRQVAPSARLVVDANEGWTTKDLPLLLERCREHGVELVEQPLPEGKDEALAEVDRCVPVCADESVHGLRSLDATELGARYDAVNIKLDKAGGLTEALAMVAEAQSQGLIVMVGCMVATSLAMAPATLLSGAATIVDLDGPLLLDRDREGGLRFTGSRVHPASRNLWG